MARSFTAASSQYLSRSSAVVSALPLTMACWFKVNDTTATYTVMSIGSSSSVNPYAIIQLIGATDNLRAAYRGADLIDGLALTSTTYTAGTWYHACCVFTSTASRIAYLNGAGGVENTTSSTGAWSVNQTTIAALGRTTFIQHTDGVIAYPCVWNVALTAGEVALLATGVHPSLLHPESIAAQWDLTGSGSPEPDAFGASSLTLSGSPTVTDNPRIILPRRNRIILPAAVSVAVANSNLLLLGVG